MKTILLGLLMFCLMLIRVAPCRAQEEVNDQAIIYQQQRMVFQQWDQDDFSPTPGFLYLNPYYWLVWGLFYPDYNETDLRPLSDTGPQTQRLALVDGMNTISNSYSEDADTVRNTAIYYLGDQTAVLLEADPLWLLYYRQEFAPLLNTWAFNPLDGLSTDVISKLLSEGTYTWYMNELDMLRERLNGAQTVDMDRGSRIMAYYRLLKEYRTLSGVWAGPTH